MNQAKYAVVGGGIGGLTLAIALQRKGLQVTVYEQTPQVKPLGAGLALAVNAMKAFRELGIDNEVLHAGKALKKLTIKDLKGNILTETDAEKISKKLGVVNNFTIHRGDLHEVLLQQLHPDTVVLGKACVDFEQRADGITMQFQDGSKDEADYVIACDGIHSVFRKKLVPRSEPRYAGYTCWRAVIENVPSTVNREETSETWGPGCRFGIVPLTHNRLYWFACVNAPANDQVMKNFDVDDLLSYFGKFHSPIPEIISATKNEQLIWGDIIDLKPLDKFSFGNIVLMGDAAHATTPNMGQGACMAIEDAVILANCLGRTPEPTIAFEEFESMRLPRTKKIVNGSWRLGQVAQIESPLLIWLRNAAVRATPSNVAEKQMRFLHEVTF